MLVNIPINLPFFSFDPEDFKKIYTIAFLKEKLFIVHKLNFYSFVKHLSVYSPTKSFIGLEGTNIKFYWELVFSLPQLLFKLPRWVIFFISKIVFFMETYLYYVLYAKIMISLHMFFHSHTTHVQQRNHNFVVHFSGP